MSMASYGIHEFLVLRDIAWFLLLGILLEEAKGRGDVAVAKLQVVAIGVTHNDLPFTALKSFHQVLFRGSDGMFCNGTSYSSNFSKTLCGSLVSDDSTADGVSLQKNTNNITRTTKALLVISTVVAPTGASKSLTPAPVKAQHTKNARRKAMMRFIQAHTHKN